MLTFIIPILIGGILSTIGYWSEKNNNDFVSTLISAVLFIIFAIYLIRNDRDSEEFIHKYIILSISLFLSIILYYILTKNFKVNNKFALLLSFLFLFLIRLSYLLIFK
jgi:uncharacterized membrane protein HdeD (DUF308 family)